MSLEDAIKMIQVHERARQGRLRAKFMKEIREQEERDRLAQTRGAPTLDPDVAACRIQKVYSSCILTNTVRPNKINVLVLRPIAKAQNIKRQAGVLLQKNCKKCKGE